MSYSVSLTYTVSISNVVAYVDNVGVSCSQYLKYECRDSTLRQYGGWYDRDGNIATFWAGGTPGGASYNCACSRDGSCADPSDHCNCDANDNVWRSDEGYITQSSYLPITIVKFGDTGDSDEEGYHTVGPLVCQG
ncbi:neurexin-4 [Lingula anatina]|uniref:Neurexin-4 n=1 Tax=Lingula anatina TaxID=7574 RepID=A0A1S3K9U8_LINAN|nr:neurexin-4 [Lingula anatina]|eukprot:XP_013419026.1 neurexin-4 [Lingula anatina]